MMKKQLLIASMALSSMGAMAQLPDNSFCPDWTGTDLDGVSHNLYSLLDSGYTVFIDVSATWCGPCWNYHNTNALENLYDNYGPGSAENAVRVFMIEGDGSTNMSDLQGNTGESQGDWITGTPYPIIDDASIGNLLEITYFPTIYMVCPNRIITEIGQESTSSLWNAVGDCASAVNPNDGLLLPAQTSIKSCSGANVDLVAHLQNLGTDPMTSATIEARQGSNVIGSTTWTGNLDTYNVADVTVATFAPTANGSVTFEITSADDDASNNISTQSVIASNSVAPSTTVMFELQPDNYGSETTWKLFRPNGTIEDQGGPYSNGSQSPDITTWTLDDLSCYRLEVYDAYGDGICCDFGNGYYKVTVNGNTVVEGGQFDSEDVKLFKTDAAIGISENALERSLNIYPNPTTGLVNLEYNLELGTSLNVEVTDVVGKVVMDRSLRSASGVQRQTLDLGSLTNGMYLIKVDAGNYQATRTITLSK